MGPATRTSTVSWCVVLSALLLTICAGASEAEVATEEASCATDLPDEEPEEPVDVIKATMDLTKTHNDGTKEIVPAHVYMGDDITLAAFRFCVNNSYSGVYAMKQTIELLKSLQPKLDQIEDTTLPEVLRTAGAYMRRAKEASGEGRHLEAGADYLRAVQRPGLDPETSEKFEQALSSEFYSARRQLEAEAREREEAAKVAARAEAEAEAAAEAAARHAANEEDWQVLTKEMLLAPEQSDKPVVTSIPMGLINPGQHEASSAVTAAVHEGMDAATAAFHFCVDHKIPSPGEVLKMKRQLQAALDRTPGYTSSEEYPQPEKTAPEEWMAKGLKKIKQGDFEGAGEDLSRAVCYGQLAEPQLSQANQQLQQALQMSAKMRAVAAPFAAGQWDSVVAVLEEVQRLYPDHRNDRLWLMQARSYQQLGRWADTTRAAGMLMQCVPYSGRWVRGQPRMMGVLMGAAAGLEMDATDKALKFYQVALRHDPDQEQVGKAYKGLKKLTKTLKEAEKKLGLGYNRQALELLQEALGVVRSMGVDSGLLRSTILLKVCTAQSEMKQYDAALLSCEQVVAQRQTPPPGMFVDPQKVAEALQARGRAHSHDNNWDDATTDYREALELIKQGGNRDAIMELERVLREATAKQREWNERRDHRAVLELPVNVHQLPQEKQCEWIKRQHKKLALKWHPDKVVGSSLAR
eukprot:CAMPEP_0118922272 /NCGR_PEP_ID=MMETSP1169-20130426/1255_1 /TAXON_ID=36882 /ORGANISM="Pyramimonas obovata, Strain CCMP722" /LENGTH=691 /DNA_ID=CAMNT_0006863111 /DNA_START=71 /DNA_END=2142 /DNA_ORIENTATION=+